jgi:hypothetical protein
MGPPRINNLPKEVQENNRRRTTRKRSIDNRDTKGSQPEKRPTKKDEKYNQGGDQREVASQRSRGTPWQER